MSPFAIIYCEYTFYTGNKKVNLPKNDLPHGGTVCLPLEAASESEIWEFKTGSIVCFC